MTSQQHITVTTAEGETIEVTTSDPDVAREYEQLPFESNRVASVTVIVAD